MEYKILETWGFGGPHTCPLESYRGSKPVRPITNLISRALHQSKNEINMFYQEGKWDDYKKITNPYEYIFLSWNRRSSRSVATRQPLSRSYFKMVELWNRIGLTECLSPLVEKTGGFVSAHAAEGPGGFIEACTVVSQKCKWSFLSASAITLRSEAKNVPGWRKTAKFLSTYPQVEIHDGADGTGNILLKANQDAFVSTVRSKQPEGVHLFTADGGFDFSNDYNAQEDSIFPLLLAETLIGLRVLSVGGCLVIKCFDTVEQYTLDLLWIITRAFSEWGIVKPCTSRAGNAERYIVGKGFLGNIDDILAFLEAVQSKGTFNLPLLEPPRPSVQHKEFLASLAKLQEMIEQVEMYVIRQTLQLIKHTDQTIIRTLVRENVVRSIQWCRTHDEECASFWIDELEKNVQKETNDLYVILHPNHSKHTVYSYSSTPRLNTNHLTFEGFRTPTGITSTSTSLSNPFMRTKTLQA